MKKLQVAIFISGRGSNLESLIQSSLKKQSLVEVQLVVSNNSKAKGLTIAKKNKIKTKILNLNSIQLDVDNEKDLTELTLKEPYFLDN